MDEGGQIRGPNQRSQAERGNAYEGGEGQAGSKCAKREGAKTFRTCTRYSCVAMDATWTRSAIVDSWTAMREPAIEDEATKKKRPAPFIGISLFRLYLNAGTGSRYPWIRIGNKGNLGIGLLFDSDCFHLLFFYSEISARNGRNEIRGRWGDFLVSSINNKKVVELTQISVSILISRIRRKNLWSLRKGEERERFRLSRARKSRLLG